MNSTSLARVIAVSNQKGGVGKTTTAINLSACLAHLGKNTLLIDLDPQANATSGLGAQLGENQKSILEVLREEAIINDVLVETPMERLYLAPASHELISSEVDLAPSISREMRLHRAIRQIREVFDYIIMDTPPSIGLLTLNALAAADSVLIPLQCEYFALEGLSQLLKSFELVKSNLNPALAIEGIVLTMFDARNNLSHEVMREIQTHLPDKLLKSVIPRNVRLSESPSHGLPINLYDSASRGALAYIELAREIIMLREPAQAATPQETQ